MNISSRSIDCRITPARFLRSSILALTLVLGALGCSTDSPPIESDAADGGGPSDIGPDTTESVDIGDTSGAEDSGEEAEDAGEDTRDDNDTAGSDTSGEDTSGGDTSGGDTEGADATDTSGGGSDVGGDADSGLCEPSKSDETLCMEQSVQCGKKIISSSCGQTEIACGKCTKFANSTCKNDSCTCEPSTCNDISGSCGVFSDGCGDTISCTQGCTNALATGGYHTCFLDRSASEVRCWGWNKYGQLGKGSASTNTYNTPQTVSTSFNSPTSLTAGEDMTCLVDKGSAKCWGANYHGQALGYQQNMSGNTIKKVLTPKSPKVPGVGIREIEAQVQHTCAITSSKEVYCWGHNWPVANGILINSKTKTAVKPTQYTFGNSTTTRIVDTGALHTCAETVKGELWCFGTDHFGAIGDGGTQKLSYHSPTKVSGFQQGFLQVESG
ncbi:MAG: hypothetical protein ABEN55_20610, partial [Bradymonadaceae bacterium]